MKKLARMLLICTILLSINLVSLSAEQKIKIVFWHHEAPEERVAAFQKVINLFEKDHPNIEVVQEVVTYADYYVKTQAAIASNSTPDFQFTLPDHNMYIYRMNALLPVTDLVKELDQKYSFFKSQIAPYQINNEYWGVPIFSWCMMLNYRPSILKKYVGTTKPPKTWGQMLNYAKKINHPPTVYGVGLSIGENLFANEAIYVFMTTAGATVFDKNGNVSFNSPQTVKTVKFYNELFKYTPPGASTWSWGELELNFMSGKIGMAPYPSCFENRFVKDLKSTDYAAAAIPKPSSGGVDGSITYPNGVHIYKSAKEKGHLEAAYEFIRFMMRPEINAILTAEMEPGAFMPATVAAQNAKEFWNNPVVKTFEKTINRPYFDVLKNASLYGFEYGYASNYGIGDIINANIIPKVLEKVNSGEMTAEKAVEWGAKEMEKFSKPIK